MSVSSVSHRPSPPPVEREPVRAQVKAAAKEPAPKPKVEAHPHGASHAASQAQPTYSHAKEKTTAMVKGQRVDVKA
jgi:hypothetical protein